MYNMEKHPITPPFELVKQWWDQHGHGAFYEYEAVAIEAARWGADQELEACCDWIKSHFRGMRDWSEILREERRPEKPTLQEKVLDILGKHGDLSPEEHDAIQTALKQL